MNAMTHDQLRQVAPSVFTRSAFRTMSSRYRVAATADVVDLLEGIGLFPVRAQQSRCRLPDKRDYVRHLVRFRRSEDMEAGVSTEIPEVILTNSFDGSTAYGLSFGLFRVACLNGLVCPTASFGGISIRHKGGDDFGQRIIDATYRVVEQTPAIMNTVEEWKGINLTRPRQIELAEAAWQLKPHSDIKPAHLLTARREADYTDADGNRSLWTSYNCIEESLIRGGLTARNARGRQVTTRPVKAIEADLRIHKALWSLAEQVAAMN